MTRPVYISGVSYIAPGVQNEAQLLDAWQSVRAEGFTPRVGSMALDKESPFYPSQKDLKAMRPDVVAATMCARELIDSCGLTDSDLSEVSLYVSTGPSLDVVAHQMSDMSLAYLEREVDESIARRNQRVSNVIHPLYALRSLTNAAESFIAQTCGICGDNTTFGATSLSGFHALEHGYDRIRHGDSSMALVGVSNGSGQYSDLLFGSFAEGLSYRGGSDCAVFVLLESGESARRREAIPICTLGRLNSRPVAPDLSQSRPPAVFDDPLSLTGDGPRGELALFCGGTSDEEYEAQHLALKELWPDSMSWYELFGHFGAGGLFFHLALAICLVRRGLYQQIDCLDSDPYGREATVSISARGSERIS